MAKEYEIAMRGRNRLADRQNSGKSDKFGQSTDGRPGIGKWGSIPARSLCRADAVAGGSGLNEAEGPGLNEVAERGWGL
jgi:hypothetical protein